jgi:hypothetical protein
MEDFIMSILQRKKKLSLGKAVCLFGMGLLTPFFSAGAQGAADLPNCMEPVITGSTDFPSPAVGSTATFLLGTITNLNNVITPGLTDYATITTTTPGTGTISVIANKTIPAGSRVGFVTGSATATGITIVTTSNGAAVETHASVNPVSLGNNTYSVEFITTQDCNEINIIFGGMTGSINVYYAFASLDSDGDGVYNCLDQCPGGDDKLDGDQDGIPNACDPVCDLFTGDDFQLCSTLTSYDLGALVSGTGLTWSLLSSPAGATINTSGVISGMGQEGTYSVEITAGEGCTDIVNITQSAQATSICNTPITGEDVVIFDPSNGGCLLCLLNSGSGNAQNVIDNDLRNYAESSDLGSLLNQSPIIGVQDNSQIYPAGTRTGFIVSTVGGLISAELLPGFEIETYLNGVLQETATVGGSSALTASGMAGTNGNQRISFVTTKPFNGIALIKTNLLEIGLFNSLRVYNAFQEPVDGCSESTNCTQIVKGTIGARTGFSGLCLLCNISGTQSLVDDDVNNYASMQFTAGFASTGTISILPTTPIGPNNQVGFTFANNTGLIDLSLLSNVTVTTYLGGVQQESYTGNSTVVGGDVLDLSDDRISISFLATKTFDEVVFSVFNVLGVAETIDVFYAITSPDSDGDGAADCADRCCLGDDFVVNDNGIPVACESAEIPLADKIARLRAAGATTGIQAISANTVQVTVKDGYVTVNSPEEITGLKLYDVSGKLQYNSSGSGNNIERFAVPAQAGVSIITIETAEKVETQKVVF